MYIPEFNKVTDRNEILSFIGAYPFANLVSVIDKRPYATPLPFLIEQDKDDLYLVSHCAKANIHGDHLIGQTHMIIFQEPHAFITNADYIRPTVPTWNYAAVHAYGEAQMIEDNQDVLNLMMDTMRKFDQQALESWPEIPEHRKKSLLTGITCFKIKINDLQAKYKLSQNKMKEEQQRISDRLLKKENSTESEIGKMMKRIEKP